MMFRSFLMSVCVICGSLMLAGGGVYAQQSMDGSVSVVHHDVSDLVAFNAENCKGFGAGVTDSADCKFVGEGDGLIDVAQGEDTDLAGAGTSLIKTVNNVINYALGLLALITLVILIYGGFVMLFSFNDDAGYKKGFTIMKNAAIALVFIGLSWILVRFIFFVIDFITK